MRDLSLAQQGRLSLDRRRIDLSALVREVVDLTQPLAQEKKMVLTATVNEAVFVAADRDRIAQVVQDLPANALRYTESDGRVWVEVRVEDADSVVEVTDPLQPLPPHRPFAHTRHGRGWGWPSSAIW